MEHIISKKSLIKGTVKTKGEEKEDIISLKQKLNKLGYTPGEVEYILRNCTSSQEAIQILKDQLDIANKCLNLK